MMEKSSSLSSVVCQSSSWEGASLPLSPALTTMLWAALASTVPAQIWLYFAHEYHAPIRSPWFLSTSYRLAGVATLGHLGTEAGIAASALMGLASACCLITRGFELGGPRLQLVATIVALLCFIAAVPVGILIADLVLTLIGFLVVCAAMGALCILMAVAVIFILGALLNQ